MSDALFEVRFTWGPCADKGSGTPPQSIYDCLEYIGDPEDFQTCIEAMMLINPGGQ
jgi:hypothetical protein